MGIDQVKEANRLRYQKAERKQDHGTRGTQRTRDEVRAKAELAESTRRKQGTALVREHFQPAKEVQNTPENIELKRRIRRRVKAMVQESVDQWRGIWGSNQYAIKDSFFSVDTAFQNCVKEDDTPFFIYHYRGKVIRIRPSELKIYRSLLQKFPAKDKEDKPLNALSGYGKTQLVISLAGLSSSDSSGVNPLAMERSYIARQVRAEFKKHQDIKQKADNLVSYEEDDKIDDNLAGFETELEWRKTDTYRPLTEDEIAEAKQIKREKYFGKR